MLIHHVRIEFGGAAALGALLMLMAWLLLNVLLIVSIALKLLLLLSLPFLSMRVLTAQYDDDNTVAAI